MSSADGYSEVLYGEKVPARTMIQWQDAAMEARLGLIDMNIIFLLLGLYGYVPLIQEERVLESFA
ncbi:hypothetical protein J3R82DRAFT_7867 [Butyriboletus roseoflavus]|nr:hypothetical protein J3R82DRAFT_7867 [Butyriboletus roseoflavus]